MARNLTPVCAALLSAALLAYGVCPARAGTGPCGIWSQVATPVAPPARAYPLTILDPVRDRMIMWGGRTLDGTPLADLWQYSLATDTWSELEVAGTPSSNILFGSNPVYLPAPRDLMLTVDLSGQVWLLSLSGTSAWTPIGAEGPPPAGSLSGASAVYDPGRDRVLLTVRMPYGSYQDSTAIWSMDLSIGHPIWSELNAGPGPPARSRASAIYDPVEDRVVFFGGQKAAAVPLQDIWALEMDPLPRWVDLTQSSGLPPARYAAATHYDAERDRMLIFGGETATWAALKDTWAVTLRGAPAAAQLTPMVGTAVGQRTSCASVFDAPRDRLVVFGGASWEGMPEDWYPNTTYQWQMGLQVDVAVRQTGAGAVSRDSNFPCFVPGSVLTLVAVPAAGYTFAGWSGDASGKSNPLEVVVDDYKQVIATFADRTTPVSASVVSTDVTADHVRIEWYAPHVVEVLVERSRANGDWAQVARLLPNGTGHVVYEDRDVTPGERYDYRLVVDSDGDEARVGETTAWVPALGALAIDRVVWDSDGRSGVVSLTLPRADDVRLELFDPVGRRQMSWRFVGLGSGQQQARLTTATRLPAGVYFVQVLQGTDRTGRRFVVIP